MLCYTHTHNITSVRVKLNSNPLNMVSDSSLVNGKNMVEMRDATKDDQPSTVN